MAVIFGICLTAAVGIVGLAIDYGMAIKQRSRLQAAADAATLAAVTALRQHRSWQEAQAEAQSFMEDNAANLDGVRYSIRNEPGANGVSTVKVEASMSWKRTLSTVLSRSAGSLSVTSTANQMSAPLDIIFLLDVSYSMGVGADQTDIQIMQKAIGCMFARHMDGTDTRAHNAGARLRIDVVRDAMKEAIETIKKIPAENKTIRVGFTTFSSGITYSVEPTEDLDSVVQLTSYIDSPSASLNGANGGTNYHTTLADLKTSIEQRNARRADGTRTVVVMVTDGVENTRMMTAKRMEIQDERVPVTTPNYQSDAISYFMTLAPDLCDDIRAIGVTMLVLRIDYLPGTNTTANRIVSRVLPVLPDRARMCTLNPAYVLQASSSVEIQEAMKKISTLAISTTPALGN